MKKIGRLLVYVVLLVVGILAENSVRLLVTPYRVFDHNTYVMYCPLERWLSLRGMT